MKNILRRINVISIILITILALKANVYAANDSYKTNLSVDNSQVQRGESITLTISLSDISIESNEKGIGAYSAKLDFDSSILEYSSSAGTDIWEEPFYQEQLIIGNTSNGKVVNSSQSIGTITFKVKENAKLGETTIKLTNFSASTAVVDVPTEDTSIKITIIEKSNTGESGNGNQNQNQDGNNDKQDENKDENSGNQNENGNGNGSSGNGSSNGNSNINDAKKDDIKEGTLPQSGDRNMPIFILISLFTVVAITLLIRIILINKKIKKNS